MQKSTVKIYLPPFRKAFKIKKSRRKKKKIVFSTFSFEKTFFKNKKSFNLNSVEKLKFSFQCSFDGV